jgi:hypothetical protein
MAFIFGRELIMRDIFRRNHLLWAISLFLFMFAAFLYVRPSIAFNQDGSIKPFGVKKKGSTVFPVWWWTILFAALSRFGVSYAADYTV